MELMPSTSNCGHNGFRHQRLWRLRRLAREDLARERRPRRNDPRGGPACRSDSWRSDRIRYGEGAHTSRDRQLIAGNFN